MAAMALNLIPFLQTHGKTAPTFHSGTAAKRALTPTLSLRERGLAMRAFVFRDQSLTVGEMDLWAGSSAAKPSTPGPFPSTAGSAPD